MSPQGPFSDGNWNNTYMKLLLFMQIDFKLFRAIHIQGDENLCC